MESVEEKCALPSVPGLQVKFDPEEAEQGKAFMEIAQSEEDACTLLRRRYLYGKVNFIPSSKLDMRNSYSGAPQHIHCHQRQSQHHTGSNHDCPQSKRYCLGAADIICFGLY